MRSLTEPNGFCLSILPRMRTFGLGDEHGTSTIGVLPIMVEHVVERDHRHAAVADVPFISISDADRLDIDNPWSAAIVSGRRPISERRSVPRDLAVDDAVAADSGDSRLRLMIT